LNEVKPIIVLEVTLMGFAALYPSYGLVRLRPSRNADHLLITSLIFCAPHKK
jgi:hypothetical protein